jgi:hypothetical protein
VRRSGETHGPKLGDVVRERLSLRDPDIDSVQWDSWRKDDSVWTVRMSFRIGGLPYDATWSFDPPRRLVHPVDDEARLLSSDAAPDTAFPFVARSNTVASNPGTRSAQVTSLQSWHGRPAAAAGQGSVTQLPVRPNGSPRPSAAAAAAGTAAAAEVDLAEAPAAQAPTSPAQAPAAATGRAAAGVGTGAGSAYSDALFGPVGPHKERLRGDTDQQAVNDGVTPGRRATVPSWDEIVFGTRRRKAD